MLEVVIVAAKRTAIGKFGGSLLSTPAKELGAKVISALLAETNVQPGQVSEVIMGQVLTAGCGQNPARQAAIAAGLPVETPALTINKVCGSGLEAVCLAAQAIRCGDAEIVIAGGQENMSMAPHLLTDSRYGRKMGDWKMVDSMVHDGLWDVFNDYHMGTTAENLVKLYSITRQEQDEVATLSQEKALAAQQAGRFHDEIVPLQIPLFKKAPFTFDADEFIRPGTTLDTLGKLKPVFIENGTVTAGNASGVNDGAAALMVTSTLKARELGLEPLATIASYGKAGVAPAFMGTGPIPATRHCLEKLGWTVNDLDLIEANEAFAAQIIAVNRELEWDLNKVNVNGGAIALGHPIGATGARILVTLVHEMKKREARKGLATLCIGGGQGVSVALVR